MIFTPQQYAIPDKPHLPFIDEAEIQALLLTTKSDTVRLNEVIQKSQAKHRLSLEETAVLLNATSHDAIEAIKQGARELKETIYGDRIVLFAPLYVGNHCTNNCAYCGFKTSNLKAKRSTLEDEELVRQVKALEDQGQKRLILVFGEHPKYNADFIAQTIRTVYQVKSGPGEIRRVNVNAAPFSVEDFRKVKEAGIGTYQVFQETYHRPTYAAVHQGGKKRDYDWRLTSFDRAMEAGIDDVGIGALFGLYDWRFEVLALIRHVNHLEALYGVGPHTISFPRLQAISGQDFKVPQAVSDDDFMRLVAILRLAVPYTGMILTAREPARTRDQILNFGVSQIDGGTNIQMKGYTANEKHDDLDSAQFKINDDRSLAQIINELLEKGLLPSFCTACYRKGRTGEHFMEFSVPGFIKRFCAPNAILTTAEYLEDYAAPALKEKGYALLDKKIEALEDEKWAVQVRNRLTRIKQGERDLHF